MTYRYMIPAAGLTPTGGLFSDVVNVLSGGVSSTLFGAGGPSDEACLARAKAATASLDAETNRLAATWRPPDTFSVDEVIRLRDATFAYLKGASAAIDASIKRGAAADARTFLYGRLDLIYKKMNASLEYTNAIKEAQAKNIRVIEAPGLRRWVLESMTTTSNGYTAVAYFECIKPFIVSMFQAAAAACMKLAAVVRTVVGVVVEVGEAVLAIPDTVSKIWTWTKWGALGVAAYYLAKPKKPAPTSNPARRRRRRR